MTTSSSSDQQTVLVTGASGFIGSHCIVALLERGYKVRGTLRSLKRADSMRKIISRHTNKAANLEFVTADLNKDSGWDEATKGCSYVLHVASPVPVEMPKDADEIIVPAREGTLRVLTSAAKNGVKRTVVTSSIAAICYGHYPNRKTDFTEADWTNPEGKDVSPYVQSKTYAERAAWEFIETDDSGMEMSTVNPCVVLGPVLEKDYGSSAEIVKKLMAGEFPGAPKLTWPIVDVRDVAELEILAMEHPKASGERFICANDSMYISDITEVLKQYFPDYRKKLPKFNLPNWFVRLFAKFDKPTAGVLIDLDFVKNTSSQKAQTLLGWKPRPNEEAIVSTGESLIEYGVI